MNHLEAIILRDCIKFLDAPKLSLCLAYLMEIVVPTITPPVSLDIVVMSNLMYMQPGKFQKG